MVWIVGTIVILLVVVGTPEVGSRDGRPLLRHLGQARG
jgi:hypothetical protein